ncbi:putative sulfate/molybdate transporter [Candidatus Deferrimicrobium sp.]|uniref:putative sulfate/molybdate transporter n=1 Tax=Candidatus Deferrimicrobium sp. TaxID=3060586 RepID=UPI002715CB5B|nr:putative sulfate/molybdate transporter [Candidatus Deferrimicrobium sp.]MDO8739447.1 putative sulfate/molybdate transporter [Candidatus Deferrimicrobium sp.]
MKSGIRINLREVAGSFGDLATFLPLAVGLITVNGMNPTSLFLSAGAMYIAAGLYFRLPIPVQPLKATSAIAIAIGASPGTISMVAFLMGCIFFLASLFNLNGLFRKVFTRPIVRGVQLGLGILLVKGGMKALLTQHPGIASTAGVPPVLFGILIGLFVAAIICFSKKDRVYPSALAVLAFGLLLGGLLSSFQPLSAIRLGWVRPEWMFLPHGDLSVALFVLLLPQVPLTFANSIAATTDTARKYYGRDAFRVTHRNLAASLGIGNLLSSLIGGMPVCHGSGGITAHYWFGARTGGASVFSGGVFVLLALLFGKSLPDLCRLLPIPVLGALLIYIGVQHARLVRDVLGSAHESAVVAGIGLVTLATGNLAIAFGGGILMNAIIARLLWRSTFRKAAQGVPA